MTSSWKSNTSVNSALSCWTFFFFLSSFSFAKCYWFKRNVRYYSCCLPPVLTNSAQLPWILLNNLEVVSVVYCICICTVVYVELHWHESNLKENYFVFGIISQTFNKLVHRLININIVISGSPIAFWWF